MRPDTRPIEDPAETSKIKLAKQGASTHDPSAPTAQTWKLPFDRSTASMLMFVVIDDPFDPFRLNRQAYEMPFGGGIHRISSALDAVPRTSPVVLLNSEGKPWTSDGFRSSWRKACKACGIEGLTFHDLRGTAVSRLALAECSVAEIATLTGHSLNDVGAILEAHYLNRDPALAISAIGKLETGTQFPDRMSDRA